MKLKSQSSQNLSIEKDAGCIDSLDSGLKDSLEQLVQGDFHARWQAAKILKDYGEEAHAPLIDLAQTSFGDPDLQEFIVSILGVHLTPTVLLALTRLLNKSTDDEVRETIILTLGKQGPDLVDKLMEFATQPELQQPVLRALVQIHHPKTIDGLLHFSTHESSDVRAMALDALGQFHAKDITATLIRGLTDLSPNVRSVCVKALGLRGKTEINEALISKISPLLYDLNADVCHRAARTLGRLEHPLGFESLWRCLLESQNPKPLIKSIIQALGWSRYSIGASYLSKLLSLVSSPQDSDYLGEWSPELVMELLQVIGTQQGDGAELDELEQRLTHLLNADQVPFNQVQVQQRLIMAIARLGNASSIPSLIQSLSVEDDRIRFHLIAALKQIDPEQSYEQLCHINQDPALGRELKTGIAIALEEW